MSEQVATKDQLQAALKWLLENQVYVQGGSFIEAGCGCCSGLAKPPAEIEKTIREVLE